MTINLSLILQTTRIQKQFPLPAFVFIDSSVVSALQDARGYAISRQNNYELHLGCHTRLLSYFTLVCLWYGRTVGQAYGHVITKFSRMDRQYFTFLPIMLHGARESFAIMLRPPILTLSFCSQFKKKSSFVLL